MYSAVTLVTGGWLGSAFAGGVGVAAVVIVVEPVAEGQGSFLVAGVGPAVGPLVGQGAVEAFDAPMFVKLWMWQASGRVFLRSCLGEVRVDLAGDVALEAADDFSLAEAFSGAAFDVVAGGLMVPHPDDGDDVEGAVGGPVAAAAEPVSAGGASAACWLWRDST